MNTSGSMVDFSEDSAMLSKQSRSGGNDLFKAVL